MEFGSISARFRIPPRSRAAIASIEAIHRLLLSPNLPQQLAHRIAQRILLHQNVLSRNCTRALTAEFHQKASDQDRSTSSCSPYRPELRYLPSLPRMPYRHPTTELRTRGNIIWTSMRSTEKGTQGNLGRQGRISSGRERVSRAQKTT